MRELCLSTQMYVSRRARRELYATRWEAAGLYSRETAGSAAFLSLPETTSTRGLENVAHSCGRAAARLLIEFRYTAASYTELASARLNNADFTVHKCS